jgi:hypothetical protein
MPISCALDPKKSPRKSAENPLQNTRQKIPLPNSNTAIRLAKDALSRATARRFCNSITTQQVFRAMPRQRPQGADAAGMEGCFN